MKAINKILLTTLIAGSSPALVYLSNPFEVQTENIRPRILGHDIYKIPSRSMQPTLVPGDYIIISNTAYLESTPERGDIVIFTRKLPNKPSKSIPFIKRAIGLAGDHVQIKNGTVFINNIPLKEDYIKPDNIKRRYSRFLPKTLVPKGTIFVLGDNRDNSRDSRLIGFIPEADIIGKATSILYGKNNRSGQDL